MSPTTDACRIKIQVCDARSGRMATRARTVAMSTANAWMVSEEVQRLMIVLPSPDDEPKARAAIEAELLAVELFCHLPNGWMTLAFTWPGRDECKE